MIRVTIVRKLFVVSRGRDKMSELTNVREKQLNDIDENKKSFMIVVEEKKFQLLLNINR